MRVRVHAHTHAINGAARALITKQKQAHVSDSVGCIFSLFVPFFCFCGVCLCVCSTSRGHLFGQAPAAAFPYPILTTLLWGGVCVGVCGVGVGWGM